jgi:hypothetical protein
MVRKVYIPTVHIPYGMWVGPIKIEPPIMKKIASKHHLLPQRVWDVFDDAPIFRRVGGGQHLALGYSIGKLIAVFFTYNTKTKEALVATAYPASERLRQWHHNTRK